ncbi:MAG: LPS translocon maturation chaperone LptM [Neptuniibacter sp.]
MQTEKKYFGLALLFSLLLLGGCGQKGPLYLPDGENQKQTQQK